MPEPRLLGTPAARGDSSAPAALAPSLRVTRAAADVVPFPAADEAAAAQLAA
ncbi:hypothetical protein ACIQFU_37210 [Streptomyces sp. NPDC093065]|uniref:hypothetical protein n=1 Tax=Streptomyces sp. NPDC093065 TaxID=3366021 RepID=UPI003824D0F6